MAQGSAGDRRRIWPVAAGAAVGVAAGIVVGVTTDIPLAPEGGLLLGGLAGWLFAARPT
jgi:hypothetical protein